MTLAVKSVDSDVSQMQMVCGDVGGHRQTSLLGLSDHIHPTPGRQMHEVSLRAGLLDQKQISRECDGLGHLGDTG